MKAGTDSTRFAGFRFVAWAVFLLVALVLSGEHSDAQQMDLVVGTATAPPYVATNSITNLGNPFVISGPVGVTFTAGSVIKLEAGFHATAGTAGLTFHATIEPSLAALKQQTITFPGISTQTAGTSLTLSATASSNLPVTLTSSTTSVCTVTNSTASLIMAGTCTIVASQLGDSTYASAIPAVETFTVSAASVPGVLSPTAPLKEYIYFNGQTIAVEHAH